jgi:PIN domain nuclease of toxin-antitoxin system
MPAAIRFATTRLSARTRVGSGGPRALGLSLGDRACRQLAAAQGATAVPSDRAWLRVKAGARVELLR